MRTGRRHPLKLTDEARAAAARCLEAVGFDPGLAAAAVAGATVETEIAQSVAWAAWHRPVLYVAARAPVVGITLGSTIYLRGAKHLANWPLTVHELVHVAQYARDGHPRFLARYGADYLSGRMRGAAWREAYEDIRDEQQARAAESVARQRACPAAPWWC